MSQAITEAMELKPCPFCDGAPRIVEPHQSDRSIEGETDDEEWLSFIECDCVDMFFVKGSATSQDEARQSVVTAWNRRPALSAGQAQPVAIKPLEWSEVIGRDDQYFKGISAPGYRIDWHGYGQGEGPYKLDKHGEFDTLEAAKAAAQSDYEARIRSAISVPLPEIEGGDKGDGWQPIETAPKDWTNVILFDPERDPPVFEGYYSMADGGRDCWVEDRGMGSEYVNPTHWMPLPAAPSASIEGETP